MRKNEVRYRIACAIAPWLRKPYKANCDHNTGKWWFKQRPDSEPRRYLWGWKCIDCGTSTSSNYRPLDVPEDMR